MKIIARTKYLNRIVELNGTPDIKIITGIRRSGKSKLMQAYIEYLKSHFENINIIFIDFMDLAYEEIKEYHALHAYVENHYQAGKTNYLFVDEIQMCPKFELAINSLYSKGKYDIYVTGSNAFLLSADLATLFTGRYIEIHVFPFSFQEYCRYNDDVSDKDKLFDEYSTKGGLAGSYVYKTEKMENGDNGFKIYLPARTAVCIEKVKKPRKAKEAVVEEVIEKPKAKRTRKAKTEK